MPQPTPNTTSWWRRLRARRAAPDVPDAAEMGTAFGLELSLPPTNAEPPRAAALPRRGWWTRRRVR